MSDLEGTCRFFASFLAAVSALARVYIELYMTIDSGFELGYMFYFILTTKTIIKPIQNVVENNIRWALSMCQLCYIPGETFFNSIELASEGKHERKISTNSDGWIFALGSYNSIV